MDGVTVKSLADPTFLNNEIANGLVPALLAALQLRVRVLARVPLPVQPSTCSLAIDRTGAGPPPHR